MKKKLVFEVKIGVKSQGKVRVLPNGGYNCRERLFSESGVFGIEMGDEK